MKVIRHKDFDVYDYCGDSWGKELYKESCVAFTDTNPVTIIEHLTAADINPPAVHKGRGRPKSDVLNHKQLHKNWIHNHDDNIDALNVKS